MIRLVCWSRAARTGVVVAAVLAAPLAGPPGVARAQSDAAPEDPPPETTELDAAAWLAGCWRVESPDGQDVADEQWMAPRAGLMVGMSRTVRGGEARGYELLTLRVEDGTLVYHAVPSGQQPTDFRAIRVDDRQLEFVNSGHDFPQKIAYTRHGDDQIEAAVFGETSGSDPAFTIPYQRVSCPD